MLLLLFGWRAIRAGQRGLHPRWMVGAVSVGVLFLVGYAAQVLLLGHSRFPGDDWIRTLFVVVLTTHTLLALSVPPLVIAALYYARKKRFDTHRLVVRFAFPIWLYVAATGVLIYWMNNHLRPQGLLAG